MEISGKVPPLKLYESIKKVDEKSTVEKTRSQHSTTGEKGDRVILSRVAQEIQEAKKLIKSMPEIREDKVAEIKQKIADGTYEIDSNNIASKMLKELLENESFSD